MFVLLYFTTRAEVEQLVVEYVDFYNFERISRNRGFRQYRTNELVRRRMNFSSDAMADFEGLLEVNRKICQQQMAEKASPTLPTNCAVLPLFLLKIRSKTA